MFRVSWIRDKLVGPWNPALRGLSTGITEACATSEPVKPVKRCPGEAPARGVWRGGGGPAERLKHPSHSRVYPRPHLRAGRHALP